MKVNKKMQEQRIENKQFLYNGKVIEYKLLRSKIKNLYIQVKDGKVIVKVPKKINDKYINDFINKKASWILKSIEKSQNKVPEKEIEQEDLEYLERTVKKAVTHFSKEIGQYPNKVRIRNIKYAWGTCSSKRNITISLKLAIKSEEEISYVVLHELCHLKYMNHSKDFWNLVERNMPEYKIYRKKLKE